AAPSGDTASVTIGAPRFAPSLTPRDGPGIDAGTRNASASAAAFDAVLAQHLGQSEAFLTLFRSSVRSGRTERLASATARELLSTNRLLLDSRAGRDLRSRQLLQDLELVLAQITQLRADGDSTDVHLITEGIDEGDVLPRLRIAVPAGI
ncbi:MAG: hypothetical protein H0U85_03300, partial [Gemmatimonadales bacterium]|nr:hypothetical protein [Gemmatimonadales bacterium]